MMPTMKEIETADREQICCWYRFLPTPTNPDDKESFKRLNRIVERFKEVGGFTPEISKHIGW